jgi:DNA invertase Pin-like site-specific DNA recombinase
LLNSETTNKIITLLDNGFSWRKTAQLADVSVSTVQRIANSKRSHIERLNNSTALINSKRNTLDLHGDILRRYLDVRHEKEMRGEHITE